MAVGLSRFIVFQVRGAGRIGLRNARLTNSVIETNGNLLSRYATKWKRVGLFITVNSFVYTTIMATATDPTMTAQEYIANSGTLKGALSSATKDMRTLEFIIDCQQRYIRLTEPQHEAEPDAKRLEFECNADALLTQWDNLKTIRDELKSRAIRP